MSRQYEVNGLFEVEVTAENIDRIRALETTLRERYDWSVHDADSVADIAIGDHYAFADAALCEGEDFEDIGSPLLHIAKVATSKVLVRAGYSYRPWADAVFTEWAALTGPFTVWLQLLDKSGQHEVQVRVTEDGISDGDEEEDERELGESFSITAPFSVIVTEENLQRVRALDAMLREQYEYSCNDFETESEITVGVEYRFADSWYSTEGDDIDDIGEPSLYMPGTNDLFSHMGWQAKQQWEKDVFIMWADIAGPYEVVMRIVKRDWDDSYEVRVTPNGFE
jgi:hypothetical protein